MLGLSVRNGFSGMLHTEHPQQPVSSKPVTGHSNAELDSASAVVRQAGNSANFDMPANETPIQTAGVNGDVDQVDTNSARLLALAQQYKDSNQEAHNALTILAQKGEAMARAIRSEDQSRITDTMAGFLGYYSGVVVRSGVYAQLSIQDQSLVNQLSNQNIQISSEQIGQTVYGSVEQQLDTYIPNQDKNAVSATVAAKQVNKNSDQTRQCGQNLSCQ